MKTVGRWVGEKIAEALKASIEPMQKRIAELEAITLKERRVWNRAGSYTEGDCVTHGGVYWSCVRSPTYGSEPGKCSKWRLLFKSARPAATEGAAEMTRPVYTWGAEIDEFIRDGMTAICDAHWGQTDEVVAAAIQEFLAEMHERFPMLVSVESHTSLH